MAKRVRKNTVRNWASGAGVTGIIGLLMWGYLAATGAIEVIDYSGDMQCAGTLEDPCIAWINFTTNEDIFLYPDDAWQLSTDKPIRTLKFYRKWGNGWKEIPYNLTCTGTWCGAPDNKGVSYSFAFREGRNYLVKYEATKVNPDDTVKWSWGFEGEEVDPVWLPAKRSKVTLVNKNLTRYDRWNRTWKQAFMNKTCIWNATNSSWKACEVLQQTGVTEYEKLVYKHEWQEITVNGKTFNNTQMKVWCWDDTPNQRIICRSTQDGGGNSHKKEIKWGESYFEIRYDKPTPHFVAEGHLANTYRKEYYKMVNTR